MERFAIKFDGNIPFDLCKVCRLCGTNNLAVIPILENKSFFGDEDIELWKKIHTCVGIKVSKNDKMPKNICNLCHDKILDFFEYREMCSSIDLQTRRLLGLPTVDVKKKSQKRKCEELISPVDSKLMKLSGIGNDLLVPNKVVNYKNTGKETKKNKKTKDNKDKLKTEITNQVNEHKYETNSTNRTTEAINNHQFNKKEFSEKKNIVCFICGGSYNSIKFEEHLKKVHVPRIVNYHCVRCNETMSKKIEIKNHNLWHKLSRTPFSCGRCNKNVDTLAGYTRHINECLTFDQKNVYPSQVCRICGKEFETQNLFDWHPCIISTLKCPKCNKTFTTVGNTLKHIVRCNVKSSSSIFKSNKLSSQLKMNPNIFSTEADKAFTEHNAFVLIPTSSTSSSSSEMSSLLQKNVNEKNKKSKKMKKDMQRVDDLLKSTYETLQNIKQEPKENSTTSSSSLSTAVDNHGDTINMNSTSKLETETQQETEGDYHDGNDGGDNDFYSSDDETPQNNVKVKQEAIDINYGDFDKVASESDTLEKTTTPTTTTKTSTTTALTTTDIQNEHQQEQQRTDSQEDLNAEKQQPTIKLKIKKEHGTLNSSLVDNTDLNEDMSSKKRKKKKKKIYKGTIDVMPISIKQEPIDQEEEEEDLQTDQNDTQDEDGDNYVDENQKVKNHNQNDENNMTLLPIISSVSSLADNSTVEKLHEKSNLPVISSVFSAVVKLEPSTDMDSSVSTETGISLPPLPPLPPPLPEVRIKQEIMVDDSSYINKDETTNVVTEERQMIPPQIAEISYSNGAATLETTEANIPMNMEMVQIKREIDYDDYANQISGIQGDISSLPFMNNVTIKEEYHMTYYENSINCDYENNEHNINNLTINNENEGELYENEKHDLINASQNEVDNYHEIIENPENNSILNSSDSVFSFKKIVLKNFDKSDKEEIPVDQQDQCEDQDQVEKNTLIRAIPYADEGITNEENTEEISSDQTIVQTSCNDKLEEISNEKFSCGNDGVNTYSDNEVQQSESISKFEEDNNGNSSQIPSIDESNQIEENSNEPSENENIREMNNDIEKENSLSLDADITSRKLEVENYNRLTEDDDFNMIEIERQTETVDNISPQLIGTCNLEDEKIDNLHKEMNTENSFQNSSLMETTISERKDSMTLSVDDEDIIDESENTINFEIHREIQEDEEENNITEIQEDLMKSFENIDENCEKEELNESFESKINFDLDDLYQVPTSANHNTENNGMELIEIVSKPMETNENSNTSEISNLDENLKINNTDNTNCNDYSQNSIINSSPSTLNHSKSIDICDQEIFLTNQQIEITSMTTINDDNSLDETENITLNALNIDDRVNDDTKIENVTIENLNDNNEIQSDVINTKTAAND